MNRSPTPVLSTRALKRFPNICVLPVNHFLRAEDVPFPPPCILIVLIAPPIFSQAPSGESVAQLEVFATPNMGSLERVVTMRRVCSLLAGRVNDVIRETWLLRL